MAILFVLFPLSRPQLYSNLENQQPAITMKTSSLAATGGVRTALKLLQNPITRDLSLFGQSSYFLEDISHKAVFIWSDSELPLYEQQTEFVKNN